MSFKPIVSIVAVILLLSGLVATQAQDASVPQLINYQGRLTGADGKELPTADYKLSISLYSDPTATAETAKVWGPQTFNVPVVKGHFNVILGPTDGNNVKIQDAFTTRSIYLEVTVNDTSIIKPRQQILSAPFALRALHGVPVGTIVPYFGLVAPEGWVLCSGQEIDKDTSPHLANLVNHLRNPQILGTTSFQGPTPSKALVPDMRGRMPLGLDNIGGTAAGRVGAETGKTVGGSGGAELHALSTAEMPNHSHLFKDYYFSETSEWRPNNNAYGSGDSDYDNGPTLNFDHNTEATGAGQPHNNMPPYLTMNYIIKY